MAELQRIKVFQTEADFCNIRHSLLVPSTAHCVETSEVFFQCERKANVGDVVLYDKYLDEELLVYYTEYNATAYPLSTYTPTGIVVIPQWFCGDDYARVMSLVNMSCTTPETGKASNNSTYNNDTNTHDIYLFWGGYSQGQGWHDIPELINYGTDNNRYQIYVDSNNNPTERNRNWGYMPSDSYHAGYKGSTENNSSDKTAHWYNGMGAYNRLPSAYTNRLERNPLYGRGADGSQSSFLSDYNGKQNTQHILNYETYQALWETDETIENIVDYGHFPAACCCARFHTEGTEQGDWYLPAAGELGCLMPRFSIIQAALKKVASVSSAVAVPLNENGSYWSSSEGYEYYAYYLYAFNGDMNGYGKGSYGYVRAFRLLRL